MKLRPIDKKEAAKLTKSFSKSVSSWINKDEWLPNPYKDWKKGTFVALFIVQERYLCAVSSDSVASVYGEGLVFDLKKKKEYLQSEDCIITDDFCFMADYCGYPEGAFFYRVKESK